MLMDNKKITISFLGDIALNDYYIDAYKKGLNPFQNLQSVLADSSFVVGNLECVAKGELGENLLKKPRLTTTIETLNYLNTINVNIVSLANNHIYDHLEDGFYKTTKFLNNNSIKFLGASQEENEADTPQFLTKEGIKLGLLGYVTDDTNPNLPLDSKVFLNIFDLRKAMIDIEQLKGKVDHIILLLHWGGRVEGGNYPDFDQPQIAKELIDAGADLIIGHHSHTIQPYEIYKGKYIFYSLGNFCFSDFIFENKYHELPSRRNETIVVNIDFTKHNYYVDINYFKNHFEYYKYDKSYAVKVQFRNFIFKRILKIKIIWNIYFFIHKYFLPIVLFIKQKKMGKTEKFLRIYRWLHRRVK